MNNGKICISVCAETADEMIAKIKQAEELADVIEVRFDCLRAGHTESMIEFVENARIATPMIATFRAFGLRDEMSTEDAQKLWRKIGELFWAGDVQVKGPLVAFTTSRGIASYHDFEEVPENLEEIFKELSSTITDVVKIAVQTNDVTDGIPVWKLIEARKADERNVIAVAMGEAGKWTRILGLAHGSYMTYASLSEGQETADGQITAKDLVEVYRVKELDLETKVFGVIGDPVSESLSPYMHNAAFVEQEINAVFIPLQVRNLDEFMRRMVTPDTREIELNFAGFSVTMPHKQAIIKHLDVIDPTAEKIGAVNTVKIDGDKLIGYNTDAYGFITPLRERFGDLKGARVAVIGSGGAARACVFALKQEGVDVTVFARDAQKAVAFADELGVAVKPFSFLLVNSLQLLVDSYEGIVNATPMGMKGALENESLFNAEQLEGVKFVYDLVTGDKDTPIIRDAKKAGVPAIGGMEMLIQQGAKQFEIWTGQGAPIEKMKEAILKRMDRTKK